MEFTVIQGDIAEQSADTLVNAAGTSLKMGSGVAGALLDAADGPLERAAVARGPIELGEVVVTDAYGLDAEYVIHAAAMSHSGPHRIATAESIYEATRNALETADELGCESLVVPLLGCGSGGFHTHEAVPLIRDEIERYEPTTLADVRVIGYTDREFEILKETCSDCSQSGTNKYY
jgi:O-acetyl-ADP-ribose deacetylase (regulator of RNase III)